MDRLKPLGQVGDNKTGPLVFTDRPELINLLCHLSVGYSDLKVKI